MAEAFGYDLPEGPIGECWGISTRPDGMSVVVDGPFAQRTLLDVWRNERDFFGGGPAGEFPLLVKFLDSSDWLSVQVHPNDAQAVELEGVPLGKTECWYVLAAEPGAQIVMGHRARTREELAELIATDRWDDLLRRMYVAPGDFVYVPSGTIHSLGPGMLVAEVQQNCDTTYRLHDFGRTEEAGRPRELHAAKATAVATVPYDRASTQTALVPVRVPGGSTQRLADTEHFVVDVHDVRGPGYQMRVQGYELVTVLTGTGELSCGGHVCRVSAGDHLVLPAGAGRVGLTGRMRLLSCRPAA